MHNFVPLANKCAQFRADCVCHRVTPSTALARLAAAAVPFVERCAKQRAGGADAWVRTMAICGIDGAVAYSMLGTWRIAALYFCVW